MESFKKRTPLFLILTILLTTIIILIPFRTCFVFYEKRTTHPFAYLPMQTNPEFEIRYTHTIHLSDVIETYSVTDNGEIALKRLEYEDFAIGMPNEANEGEVFIERDGKYIIENMNRIISQFNILVGDVDEALEFRYSGHEFDLKHELDRGETYTFRVNKLSLLQLWKGVNLHDKQN